ncbi:MAG: hypothetical protein ACXW30_01360 [Micavibrio sp.]
MTNELKESFKTSTNKGWPPERRARQAELMRSRAPWKKSTGPRSVAGKAASSMNAMRHGLRSAGYRELCAALRAQKHFLARYNKIRNAGAVSVPSPQIRRGEVHRPIQTYDFFKCDVVHSAMRLIGVILKIVAPNTNWCQMSNTKAKKIAATFPELRSQVRAAAKVSSTFPLFRVKIFIWSCLPVSSLD